MNRLFTLLLTAITVSSLAALLSCGGGGGGFTPISYTGSTAPAPLDGTNAADFTALAGAGMAYGMIAPIPLATATPGEVPPTVTQQALQAIITLGRTLPDFLVATQQPAGLAAVTESGTVYCGIGDGTDGSIYIVATWEIATGVLTADMTFNNCSNGVDIIFNGGVDLTMTGIVADAFGNPDLAATTQFAMDQTYRNLAVTFMLPPDTVTIYAQMHFTYDATGLATVNTMDMPIMVMKLASNGLSAQVKNYAVVITEYNRNTPLPDDDYDEIILASAAVKTELYDHLLGYVTAYTLPGFPVLEDPSTNIPYAGILRLDGAGGSWAEVDFSIPCNAVTSNGSYFDGVNSGNFCYDPSL